MTDPQEFIPYALAADELMGKATKDQLLHGMANLVSALAEVMGYADDGDEDLRH